jgi:hypothetical protein
MSEQPETNDLNAESTAGKKNPRIPFGVKVAAKAMTESGFSYRETAKELDINLKTVARAVKDPTLDRKIIEQVKDVLPAKMYQVAFTIVDRLHTRPDILERLIEKNPYMAILILAINVDKARLMEGQSTENIAVKSTVQEIQTTLSQVAELKKKLYGQGKAD